MGLDQYFYDRISAHEDIEEVAYFRKHRDLHNFIGSLGYELKSGEDVFIEPEHLIVIANYLVGADYWAKTPENEDSLPTDNFLRSIGLLYYMGVMGKGLYYNADW